jgi:RNA polymerase sigma-70 factor (ECF subfamily)
MVFDAQDRLAAVMGLDITDDGQIQAIHSIANPDKLRHLGEVSDLGVRLRAGRRTID